MAVQCFFIFLIFATKLADVNLIMSNFFFLWRLLFIQEKEILFWSHKKEISLLNFSRDNKKRDKKKKVNICANLNIKDWLRGKKYDKTKSNAIVKIYSPIVLSKQQSKPKRIKISQLRSYNNKAIPIIALFLLPFEIKTLSTCDMRQ